MGTRLHLEKMVAASGAKMQSTASQPQHSWDLGWTAVSRGYPGHCRALSGITGLYPLNDNSLQIPWSWNSKRSPDIAKCPLRGKTIPREPLICWGNNNIQHLFAEHSQCARHYFKCFTAINLFKPQNNIVKQLCNYYLHYINEETKSQRGMWFFKGPTTRNWHQTVWLQGSWFLPQGSTAFLWKGVHAKQIPQHPSGVGERVWGRDTRSLQDQDWGSGRTLALSQETGT